MLNRCLILVLALALSAWSFVQAIAEGKSIVVVASTTSTEDSGLFAHLLPLFKANTGIAVRVIGQGTGQALDTARRGDADVVFVHARPQEERFVADGYGVRRFDVMYNDFVLIGPKDDPAGIAGTKDVAAALAAIQAKQAPFVSRGDRSGTHQAEIALWQAAGVDIAKDKGPWYRDIGQGMGAALNAAAATNAYVLADRGTWISFKNRGSLAIAVEGDRRLFNQYGIILVNPDKFPHVKKDEPIGYARRLGRRRSPIIASGENSSSFPTLRHAGPDPHGADASRFRPRGRATTHRGERGCCCLSLLCYRFASARKFGGNHVHGVCHCVSVRSARCPTRFAAGRPLFG